MHAYQLDFVNALSAEEQCPVCRELHAAVDECLCSQCEQHVCADCARSQPDAGWLCAPCAAPLASAQLASPQPQRSGELRLAGRQLSARAAVLWTAFLASSLAGLGKAARTLRMGVVHAELQRRHGVRWLRPRLGKLAQRSGALVTSSRSRSRQLGRSLARQLQACARSIARASAWGARWVRTLPVREHASYMLLATLILIAVARADNGPDAR